MSVKDLRENAMMAHLLDALDQGKDIGHYGRLVFAMVSRHFLSEKEVVKYLQKDRDFSEHDAQILLKQVQGRDYNPPKPEKIHAWQREQDFPICPDVDDPSACNVYRDLTFPDGIYENIAEFYEDQAASEQAGR